MQALRSIDRFDITYLSLDRWFFGIVRRVLAGYLRKHYRERKHLTFTGEPAQYETVQNARQTDDHVSQTMAQLATMEREVLIWMYQEQASVRDIANRLNRSEKAVENLLYRARQHFKELYQSNHPQGMTSHATRPSPIAQKPAARLT